MARANQNAGARVSEVARGTLPGYDNRVPVRVSAQAFSFGGAAKEVLGAVNHGDNLHTSPMIPPAAALVHYMPWDAQCMCHRPYQGPTPADIVGFRLGNNRLDVAANTLPDPARGWMADDMTRDMAGGMMGDMIMMGSRPVSHLSAEERRWIVDTLTRQVRTQPLADRGFALIVAGAGDSTRVLSYTVMPTVSHDTIV